ncbi:oxidoreductase YetM [Amycolatopsis thailandensis]|uniref:Oxidoreductase YetM n=1 Tax=Amycolatopsis thailandensis TaxID=589330 RepID=A0A229SAY2_9PSEU|nr:FAD-dependent monooxygenase [Amycolatopsis thailandensis]OXM56087.1 oxidoreductase YetM [Amycolatopsis thailandensis]
MGTRNDSRSVLIAGAGIAGLTTASSLARRGWSVEVIDTATEDVAIGWGLSLTGPALRALDDLGLADRCLAAGYGMNVVTNIDIDGTESTFELPRLIGPHRPAMTGIARPELHRILRAEALRLGAQIHLGPGVSRLCLDKGQVRAELTDRSMRTVDLLVGADGIRSTVRDHIGRSTPIRHHGQRVWRALIPRPSWVNGIHTFAGSGRQTGVVPISSGQAYVFLTENDVRQEDEPAPRMQDLMVPFLGRALELRSLVARSASVIRRPVRTALAEALWSSGPGVIIGDAAHAPSPQSASGATLAIEDGVLLAEELDHHADISTAVRAFAERRRDRCATVVETSIAIAALEREQRHNESYSLIEVCHHQMALPA